MAFAADLAKALGEGLDQRHYERLVVAAPPRFLGMLRQELSHGVSERVAVAIHHDLTHVPESEIPAALQRHLPSVEESLGSLHD